MTFHKFIAAAVLSFSFSAMAATPALDDANTVVTVMQFSVKNPESKPELLKRMGAIRDYVRKQPGLIDNVLMENRNGDAQPSYVGVSRWKSFKDWEILWTKPELQKLVADNAANSQCCAPQISADGVKL